MWLRILWYQLWLLLCNQPVFFFFLEVSQNLFLLAWNFRRKWLVVWILEPWSFQLTQISFYYYILIITILNMLLPYFTIYNFNSYYDYILSSLFYIYIYFFPHWCFSFVILELIKWILNFENVSPLTFFSHIFHILSCCSTFWRIALFRISLSLSFTILILSFGPSITFSLLFLDCPFLMAFVLGLTM